MSVSSHWGEPGAPAPRLRTERTETVRRGRTVREKDVDLMQFGEQILPYLYALVNAGRVLERQEYNIDGTDMTEYAGQLPHPRAKELKDLMMKLSVADKFNVNKFEVVDQIIAILGEMLLRDLNRRL